jgi:uncharacterized protein with FMN-binding domain
MNNHASTTSAKLGLSALAGLSLLGALTGCSMSAKATDTGADSTASSPAASDSSTVSTSSASSYKDGTYSEIGHYDSPAGNASITVAVTLASGVVTKVKVTPHATNPTAKIFQGEFVDGISAVVVGKKIDSLNVSKVSGSSLTSTGFNEAIGKIKTDASA